MRVRDVVLVYQQEEGAYITGIVVAKKLNVRMTVVEAFEYCEDTIDRLLIPHSNMILTQSGFYMAVYDTTQPGESYTIRRM